MFRLSSPAQVDIDAIWDYVAHDNPAAATRMLNAFEEIFLLLAQHPRMGRTCEDLRPDLRRFPVENYVVFYRIQPDCIEIVRVLHGTRDIERILRSDNG